MTAAKARINPVEKTAPTRGFRVGLVDSQKPGSDWSQNQNAKAAAAMASECHPGPDRSDCRSEARRALPAEERPARAY